jgi:hypothetical protein
MCERPARLFLCARCQGQVLVCSQCDRGQRYCAGGCAHITRRSRQREAASRYQQGRAGRHKHAQRMRQWRKRRTGAAKIVTHQGSQATPVGAVLAHNESPPAIPPDSQTPSPCIASASESIVASASTATIAPALVWHCHWCQSPCPALVRQGFLRHSGWWRNGHYP